MKNISKSRNRERRTKPSREAVSFQVKVNRATFEHMKHLENKYGVNRDDIFLLGLTMYNKQMAG